jgi:glucose/arabinose dehydrogenase
MKSTLLTTCLVAIISIGVFAPAQEVFPSAFFQDVLVSNLDQPVGMAFLPDGRILIIEQNTAAVKVWAGGATASLVGTVPGVAPGGEMGLLAIAVDPGWPARPYIYVWFNSSLTSNMRLAMFTLNGDLSNPASTNLTLGVQYNIVTDVPDNAGNHNGGTLRFGIDGMLYLSIGDDANSCAAQNTSSSLGCVWRLDVSSLPGAGTGPPAKSTLVPAGNPYSGPTDNARLVWCHGLRNPFRFHVDSVTGYLYIADVGAGAWEEYDEVTTGGLNLGWPWLEGNAPNSSCGGTQPASVPPIATWSHATGAASIMSLGRYRNQVGGAHNFGAAYEGDCFYADYYAAAIRRLKHNGTTWVTPPPVAGQPNATDWATGVNALADAAIGPDGAIYHIRQFGAGFTPGSLRRIRANPNAAQLAIVSGNNQAGNAGQALFSPLVVSTTTVGGAPIAGQTVNFVVVAGGGSVNPASAVTDAAGMAQTTYTLSPTYSAPPAIQATAAGVPNVTFNATWRGISVVYVPQFFNHFSVTLRHSQTNSPFTLCVQAPPPASPFLTTPWGSIWTSVLAPVAALTCVDGLGLAGPPDPAYKTGAVSPTWNLTIQPLPPMGGINVILQAYAIDTSLLPGDGAYMISNTATLTLN